MSEIFWWHKKQVLKRNLKKWIFSGEKKCWNKNNFFSRWLKRVIIIFFQAWKKKFLEIYFFLLGTENEKLMKIFFSLCSTHEKKTFLLAQTNLTSHSAYKCYSKERTCCSSDSSILLHIPTSSTML